jgi:hypothetical protein
MTTFMASTHHSSLCSCTCQETPVRFGRAEEVGGKVAVCSPTYERVKQGLRLNPSADGLKVRSRGQGHEACARRPRIASHQFMRPIPHAQAVESLKNETLRFIA